MTIEYRDYIKRVDSKLMAEVGLTHLHLEWRDWRIPWMNGYAPELAAVDALIDQGYGK